MKNKKLIRLRESELITLVKKIILETKEEDLSIGGFRKVKTFELKDYPTFLEYQAGSMKDPKIRIRFHKRPKGNNYMVDLIATKIDKNKFAFDYIKFLDDELEKSKKKGKNIKYSFCLYL